jgi:hypothetical protein
MSARHLWRFREGQKCGEEVEVLSSVVAIFLSFPDRAEHARGPGLFCVFSSIHHTL